jgi:hypothetical protein
MVNDMTHIDYETLLDYLEGRSSKEGKGRVEMHLAQPCALCDRRIALLRKVLVSVAGDRALAPPESVLQQAFGIPQHEPIHRPGLLTRLIATLSFDSDLQSSPVLTRGSARERQVLFNTGQVDIDFKIKEEHGDYDLLGQVMGKEAAFGFASLQNAAQVYAATELDAHGQFAFRAVRPGKYDLVFEFEDQEIAVNGLKVGHD